MKALKAFIKPFEAPQTRSVNIKIKINFPSLFEIGAGSVKMVKDMSFTKRWIILEQCSISALKVF